MEADSSVQSPTTPPGSSTRPSSREFSLLVVGASFKTSPLEFRERMAARLSESSSAIRGLRGVREYAELTTCNRVEIALATDEPRSAVDFFRSLLEVPTEDTRLYFHRDKDAIGHLFRVASGLDSMVVGEEQIISQVQAAGISARTTGSSRASISALFDASVSVGARARGVMRRSSSPADDSVSSFAVRFALERLGRPPRRVLLIGTGKTSRLAANRLDGAEVHVASRRSALKSFPGARLVRHRDLRRVAESADLIISATKHKGYLLKGGQLSRRRRRVILDLAFPRNIDPDLDDGSNDLFDLDDLSELLGSQLRASPSVRRAERMISEEAERFSRWLLASRQSPALAELYRWAEDIRFVETDAVLRRLPELSSREREVVEAMSRRLVSKLMAPATQFGRSSSAELPQGVRLDLISKMFGQETD